MSGTRHYLTGKVAFKPAKGDTPLTALVRERLALATRNIVFDHASGYFTILGLTFRGEDHDPEEVLVGYRETPETTLAMIRSVIDDHCNAQVVSGWLKQLVALEGMSVNGLITKLGNILSKGNHLFQQGDEAYLEFSAKSPPTFWLVSAAVRRERMQVRSGTT